MDLVLHPTYFPNIHSFAHLLEYEVTWEVMDNFQKQTYRNRCYIGTDTGDLILSIPVKHQKGSGRQLYRDTAIDYSLSWQRDHWRGLATAYRASPFFEYYEDELGPLFTEEFPSLLDFNLATIETVCELLQVDFPKRTSTAYARDLQDAMDGRQLAHAKQYYPREIPEYTQVFSDRNAFLPDLSILDLLFNLGSAAVPYLKELGKSLR